MLPVHRIGIRMRQRALVLLAGKDAQEAGKAPALWRKGFVNICDFRTMAIFCVACLKFWQK